MQNDELVSWTRSAMLGFHAATFALVVNGEIWHGFSGKEKR